MNLPESRGRNARLSAVICRLFVLWVLSLQSAQALELVEAAPMRFLIARGEPNSCGVGCDTWISAEGQIGTDTPSQLAEILDQAGARRLPIFFSSLGGKALPSLAIGRILRKQNMTAGIARTVPINCMPAKSALLCSWLFYATPTSGASLSFDHAKCYSACAYAILGAVTRLIDPRAELGVHNLRAPENSRTSQTDREKLLQTFVDVELAPYFVEMGIDRRLNDIAAETKLDGMHVLTRAELFELGIDRREIVGPE